jgi:uncharacterized protein YbaA (DUF1428 family)
MKREIKPKYVDGFVLAVPKNKINQYLRLARICGKIASAWGSGISGMCR